MKATSSKGKSPWKVKKVTRATRTEGIVIRKGSILVTQGLRKVKLEEDFVEMKPKLPVSMEIENDLTSTATPTEAVSGGEAITEEFVVTKVELDSPMSSEKTPPSPEACGSSCSCGKEVESLKRSLKDLSLTVDKQNQIIREIKSGLRNAVMSLMTCCKGDEEEDEVNRQDSSDSQESSGKTSGSTTVAEESVLLERPFVIHWVPSGSGVTQNSFGEEDCPPSIATVECTAVGGNGSQIPDSSNSDQPCVSFSIVDPGQNLTGSDGAGQGGYEAGQRQDVKDNQENDHHDKLKQQNLQYEKTTESKASQDNFNGGEDRLSSIAIVEVTDNESGGQVPDKSSNQSLVSLRSHMSRMHSKATASPIKCHLCPKVFNSAGGRIRHIQSAHEGVRYKCDHCPAKYTQLNDLQRHEQKVHREGCGPTQQCEICGVHLLKSKHSLKTHMNNLHKKSGSSSAAKEQSRRIPRKKKVKMSREERPLATKQRIIFQCQDCPLSFPKREDLRCHLRQVHGITFLGGAADAE